jgi:hypothetical protein
LLAGDNEWNDCSNYDVSPSLWKKTFTKFESKYWKKSAAKFKATHPRNRTENFTFQYNGTLFIGLNLVGGVIRNQMEWNQRLNEEYLWTASLIRSYQKLINITNGSNSNNNTTAVVGRVVIFGQANPAAGQVNFFSPLGDFVQNILKNSIPIVYIHGDLHEWVYEPNFLGQSSMVRISLVGHGKEPALKVTVNANGKYVNTNKAFIYDRRLKV